MLVPTDRQGISERECAFDDVLVPTDRQGISERECAFNDVLVPTDRQGMSEHLVVATAAAGSIIMTL